MFKNKRQILVWVGILVLIAYTVWSLFFKDSRECENAPAQNQTQFLHVFIHQVKEPCNCKKAEKRVAQKKLKKQKPFVPPVSHPVAKPSAAPTVRMMETKTAMPPAPVATAVATKKEEPVVEAMPILDWVDPEYGKTKVVFTPLPQEEVVVEAPIVSPKIYVIRERQQEYYGGSSGSWYTTPIQTPSQQVVVQQAAPAPVIIAPQPVAQAPVAGRAPALVSKPAGPSFLSRPAQ